jgi:hypothetical protein
MRRRDEAPRSGSRRAPGGPPEGHHGRSRRLSGTRLLWLGSLKGVRQSCSLARSLKRTVKSPKCPQASKVDSEWLMQNGNYMLACLLAQYVCSGTPYPPPCQMLLLASHLSNNGAAS